MNIEFEKFKNRFKVNKVEFNELDQHFEKIQL